MEWIGYICGIIGMGGIVSTYVNKKIKKVEDRQECQKSKQSAIEKGVQALLRSQIITMYNKYIVIKSVPIYERENLEHLYIEYKALGGNGVIESLMEKLNALPTE